MTRWNKVVSVVATVMIAASLAGCSGSASASKGGDTTCKEFKSLSSEDQSTVIKDLLSENGKNPSNGKILIAKKSASYSARLWAPIAQRFARLTARYCSTTSDALTVYG